MLASVLALLGLLAAGVAGVVWRTERARRAGLEAELAQLRDDAERERHMLDAKAAERRERADEVADLRRRLEKAKRRAFSVQEERAPLEARATTLEADLRDRETECKRLRDEVAKLEGDVETSRRETTRLREEMAHAIQERDKAAREVRVDPDQHRSLSHRADAAEEEVRRLTAQLREIERDAMRYRQRERTHRRLYLVIRGELGAAQDRIRQLTGAEPGEAFAEPEEADDLRAEGNEA